METLFSVSSSHIFLLRIGFKGFSIVFLGFTPLLYATETGNISCMKALLDHGATVVWQVGLFYPIVCHKMFVKIYSSRSLRHF